MYISSGRIINVDNGGKLIGIATVVFDEMFVVKGIKIIRNGEKCFLTMPSKKHNSGYENLCFPINSSVREKMEEIVIGIYNKSLDEEGNVVNFRMNKNDISGTFSLLSQCVDDYTLSCSEYNPNLYIGDGIVFSA